MPMKVLIADDHSLIREGLKQTICSFNRVALVHETDNGSQALSMIIDEHYDIVLLDISMPGLNGFAVLQKMRQLNISTPVLVLSLHSPDQYAIKALSMGALGYVSKVSPKTEIEKAITKVVKKERYLPKGLTEKIAFKKITDEDKPGHCKLSNREFQVMIFLAKGKSIADIAKELHLSDKTVSTYKRRVLNKMMMMTNADITAYAVKNALID